MEELTPRDITLGFEAIETAARRQVLGLAARAIEQKIQMPIRRIMQAPVFYALH